MHKQILNILLFLSSASSLLSQTNLPSDKLKQISLSDTVIFRSESSDCLRSTVEYKLVKLKTGERVIIFTKDAKELNKTITAKNYDVFVYRFRQSAQRFKFADEGIKECKCKTEFKFRNKSEESAFVNNTCEVEFDPEELLKQLMK